MEHIQIAGVSGHPATGTTLEGTTVAEISNSIDTHRSCTVEIANHLTVPLEDPKNFCESGHCKFPLPPVIESFTREAFAFSKTSHSLCGSVGVFSYRISGTNTRLAIMFSVPYDYNLSSNWFAAGLISDEASANEDLYQSMYYDDDWAASPNKKRADASSGASLQVEHGPLKAEVTMSNAEKAIMMIYLTSSIDVQNNQW